MCTSGFDQKDASTWRWCILFLVNVEEESLITQNLQDEELWYDQTTPGQVTKSYLNS